MKLMASRRRGIGRVRQAKVGADENPHVDHVAERPLLCPTRPFGRKAIMAARSS
jgi:hypothetical protein